MKGFLRELLITLGLVVVIYLILRIVIQSSIVTNISMEPTLVAGQRLIVVKAVYHFQEPQRGDIIVLHPPIDPENEYVKRLIGLPGDRIEVKNGSVYVNNVRLFEPYIKVAPLYTFGPYIVPENHFFVLGDNRNNSSDSHTGWTVIRQEIVGKAWLRIWPPHKWGTVGNYPLDTQVTSNPTDAVSSAQ